MERATAAHAAPLGMVMTVVRRRWIHLALLVLLAVPLLFTAQGLPLLDPDEGLYAGIAQSMVTTGDWMLPHFNGLPYLEKPPLYFWAAALTLRFDPSSERAVRIWSALSALGTVLLAWRMGRRLYSATAGVMAGIAGDHGRVRALRAQGVHRLRVRVLPDAGTVRLPPRCGEARGGPHAVPVVLRRQRARACHSSLKYS